MSDYDFKNFLPPNTEVLSSESYLQGQETHLRISHFRLAAAECVVRHGTTFTVPEGNPPERRLTPNEELTAVLGTMGLTSPQAAGLLSKRPETVRGQRHDLYKKLAITTTKSMLAVPRRLVEHGILSISTPFVTPEDFWVESETLAWGCRPYGCPVRCRAALSTYHAGQYCCRPYSGHNALRQPSRPPVPMELGKFLRILASFLDVKCV